MEAIIEAYKKAMGGCADVSFVDSTDYPVDAGAALYSGIVDFSDKAHIDVRHALLKSKRNVRGEIALSEGTPTDFIQEDRPLKHNGDFHFLEPVVGRPLRDNPEWSAAKYKLLFQGGRVNVTLYSGNSLAVQTVKIVRTIAVTEPPKIYSVPNATPLQG